jgi:predicted transposase YdaD
MKKDNKPYDTAFKDLAEQEPEALLWLVGALPPGATFKLLPREVSTPALLPDQPFEVIGEKEHFTGHIEAQTRYEFPMPSRFVDYDIYLMIPMHILKESSFYQMAVDEGREEGLEKGLSKLMDLFRQLAARRFPGVEFGPEVERVRDLDVLEQLCLDLDWIQDEQALRARLAELAESKPGEGNGHSPVNRENGHP